MPFQYKKVLLIGATSGIGEALATRFVAEGSHVIAVGRRQERLDDFVEKHGKDKASGINFDIADVGKIRDFANAITISNPDLDCVFLNAGVQRGFDFSKPETVDLDLLQFEFKVNYISLLALTNAFVPFLQSKNEETAIIFTTSGLAMTPLPRYPNYSASKAALHSFILCLRDQLRTSKIKVIELIPPLVQTELNNAKNQPESAGKAPKGIPLAQFTDEAYQGLSEGKEQVPVGTAKAGFVDGGFEVLRQAATARLVQFMRDK